MTPKRIVVLAKKTVKTHGIRGPESRHHDCCGGRDVMLSSSDDMDDFSSLGTG